MKVVQINTTVNSGSTGRIAEGIGEVLIRRGHESIIAYGRGAGNSSSQTIRIGDRVDFYLHGCRSLLLDQHGLGSTAATRQLLAKIYAHKPDLIALHNIHGYYLNFELLFEFLDQTRIPVVWTLHDCWPFTGHCAHFDFVGCSKWQTQCQRCPLRGRYPRSLLVDNSRINFQRKRRAFTAASNLTIVTPSKWLADLVGKSFLSDYEVHVIPNGVDLETFSVVPRPARPASKKIVLGVASTWDRIKGLQDFVELRRVLPESLEIVLIGLTRDQIDSLPRGVRGIERTENVSELVRWYNNADVFVNPTYVDTFPTTNIESLACGTPVITYNTGGSPESINSDTGLVVPKGNVASLVRAVDSVLSRGKESYQTDCRERAEKLFDKWERFGDYTRLFEKLISV